MAGKFILFLIKMFVLLRIDKINVFIKNIIHQARLVRLKKSLGGSGQGFSVLEGHRIINPQFIKVGDNFNALARLRIEAFDRFSDQQFTPEVLIGNNVTINPDCHIACISKVIIEDDVLIASKVFISDHFHGEASNKHLYLPPAMRPLVSKGAVVIKKNVWIGDGVCIMPGVTIGENCIIGANSVVTKSIPHNSVAAGIPCKVIKVINHN